MNGSDEYLPKELKYVHKHDMPIKRIYRLIDGDKWHVIVDKYGEYDNRGWNYNKRTNAYPIDIDDGRWSRAISMDYVELYKLSEDETMAWMI